MEIIFTNSIRELAQDLLFFRMHLIKKQTEKIQPNLTQRISFQIIHMKGLFYHHEKKEKSGKIIISKSIWVKSREYIVNLFT